MELKDAAGVATRAVRHAAVLRERRDELLEKNRVAYADLDRRPIDYRLGEQSGDRPSVQLPRPVLAPVARSDVPRAVRFASHVQPAHPEA